MESSNLGYYAVIFTSTLSEDSSGYESMAKKMVELASQSESFLGIESAREKLGITVSYWKDVASIKSWKQNVEHQVAQNYGRNKWYSSFKVRIARVEREYEMNWED